MDRKAGPDCKTGAGRRVRVAKSTTGRLTKAHGWRGVTRGRRMRTTVPGPSAAGAPDLIRRQFKAARPGQPHVADFTYVQTVTGRFAYTAFVIDAFAGLIPGWECSLSEQTAFAEAAIRQAPPTGPGTGTRSARTRSTIPTPPARAIHQRARHRDAAASRAGAPHRNRRRRPRQRPAETTIGLDKTECVPDGRHSATARRKPWPTSNRPPQPGPAGTTPAGRQATASRSRGRVLRYRPPIRPPSRRSSHITGCVYLTRVASQR